MPPKASQTNPARVFSSGWLPHSHGLGGSFTEQKSERRSKAAGTNCWCRSKEMRVLKGKGPGAAQVRRAAAVWHCTARSGALRAWRGCHKAAFISPCRAALTHTRLAVKELLSHGGEGWGDRDGGNTFDPLVLPFQKNYWCCLSCQCNVTIEMSASCKSAFCFPKENRQTFSLVHVPFSHTH